MLKMKIRFKKIQSATCCIISGYRFILYALQLNASLFGKMSNAILKTLCNN